MRRMWDRVKQWGLRQLSVEQLRLRGAPPMLTVADIRAMGWAASLRKAVEAYPEIGWEWRYVIVEKPHSEVCTRTHDTPLCGCAVGLLRWACGLPNTTGWHRFGSPGDGWNRVSYVTKHAQSWADAIEHVELAEYAGWLPPPCA